MRQITKKECLEEIYNKTLKSLTNIEIRLEALSKSPLPQELTDEDISDSTRTRNLLELELWIIIGKLSRIKSSSTIPKDDPLDDLTKL